jgi:uncharacterized protein (DUF849 family)
VHIHARDKSEQPTYHKEVYEDILRAVCDRCPDVILCVSTSGRTFKEFEQRSACLDAADPAPEMASLTLGSMNFPKVASVNTPHMIKALALKMQDRGVVPEWECFDLQKDPLEMNSVYGDPAYSNVVSDLKEDLVGLRIALGDATNPW